MKNVDPKFRGENLKILAGTDEVGRGALAGPVVAAAVILPVGYFDVRIRDSKKVSRPTREELYNVIPQNAVAYAFTVLSHKKIDEINILAASLLAMKKSVEKLKVQPEIILVDGNKSFEYNAEVIPLVKGDCKSHSIAAASIIAKVHRDRIMIKLASKYPQYGWEQNKGYATKDHIDAILKYGACPLHRKTFLEKIHDRANQPRFDFDDE